MSSSISFANTGPGYGIANNAVTWTNVNANNVHLANSAIRESFEHDERKRREREDEDLMLAIAIATATSLML